MIKYTVLPEQKKVIAIVTDCEDDAIRAISKKIPEGIAFYDDSEYKLRHSYKGIAKCHPDDTFDEETGKRIARNKALLKYKLDYLNKLDYFCFDLIHWLAGIGEKGDICANYIELISNELKDFKDK